MVDAHEICSCCIDEREAKKTAVQLTELKPSRYFPDGRMTSSRSWTGGIPGFANGREDERALEENGFDLLCPVPF